MVKKETVIAAGGYDHGTMGEDMELVVKLHSYCLTNQIPYSIKYATDAVCWTQVPEKLGDLKKQRKRWHLGLFQTMWKHKKMMANPKFGAVGFISYMYFLLYELLSPFTLTAFFSRIQTIDLTVTFKDCMKAIMLCFFEVTTLRFIMAFVRLTAFKGYKKKKLDWGRIERKKMNI